MQKVDQIIHAPWVITCDEQNHMYERAAVIIDQGKILAILPSKDVANQYQSEHTITYKTHALLPGLINCHTHSAMVAFRGLADDLDVMDWLNNYIWPTESRWVGKELVYDFTLHAMAEMIRSGTTTFNDMYFFLPEVAKAAEISGMRAHIGMTVINVPTAWAKSADEYFAKGLEFYHQYQHHDRITPTLAPHSTYGVSTESLERVKKLSDQYQLRTNIHLQEAPSEITQSLQTYHQRPIQRLHEIGLVNERLIAIHMTQVDEHDLSLITEHRPNIVHCPESNMKLASGDCPVAKLLSLDINVALGTDGAASNNDLDMLSEIRSAAFLGKVAARDPKALPAETALKMATLNGAKALGIDHITGSLSPGKSADLIAIDLGAIETQPLYHPISQIVYATSRNQVTDVWVAGKQLLRNRELVTLEEARILANAANWQEKLSITQQSAGNE